MPRLPIDSEGDTPPSCPGRVGCPIRRSRDQRSLASPPGFSQRATSFIASQCQGIHQMPFFALDHRHSNSRRNFRAAAECRTKPPRTGAKPNAPALGATVLRRTRRPHMKTLLRIGTALAGPSLSASVTLQTLSLPFKQHPASAHPGTVSLLFFSERRWPPAHCPGGGGERDRTDDLLLAKQALSQLSYTPDQRSEIRIQRSASSDLRSVSSDLWHWWAREDLNLRPHAYQARALTS